MVRLVSQEGVGFLPNHDTHLEPLECSQQPHIQGRGAKKRSGPDDWDRATGKIALTPRGVRVRREGAIK